MHTLTANVLLVWINHDNYDTIGSNPCGTTNGGCSHFCLLSAVDPRGYSCDCPEGMVLGDDLANCIFQNGTTSVLSFSNTPLGNLMTMSCCDLECNAWMTIFSGSCAANAYSSCCVNGSCQGSPSNCYCDANCHLFKDCCSDVARECEKQGKNHLAHDV